MTVTRVDREAAARLNGLTPEDEPTWSRATGGERPDSDLSEAFAAHREAAVRAERERCERELKAIGETGTLAFVGATGGDVWLSEPRVLRIIRGEPWPGKP